MFNIYTLLILAAGVLFAGDIMLVASRSASKRKPDWMIAVLAGLAGMLASEALSLVTWQFAAGLTGWLGDAAASWISVAVSAGAGAFVSAAIIYKKFGLRYMKAYLCSLAGVVPAFILYSILLGLFEGFMG